MTIQVTLDAVREAAKAAVADRGEGYIYKDHYDACRNTQWQRISNEEGEAMMQVPGCLVGDVLHRIGVPLPDLATWDDTTADDLLANLLAHNHVESVAEGVETYLVAAQVMQDTEGMTWGMALASAEASVAGVLA
jgi:hypothetical protein